MLSLAAGKVTAADLDSEKEKLQGEWVSVSYEAARTARNSRTLKLIFKGKRVTMKIDGKTEQADCDLNVDGEPKWMDFVVRDGTYVTSVNKGIYTLEGDTLTVCHGGAIRPTKLEVRTE